MVYIYYKYGYVITSIDVWEEMTDPFQNVNGFTVKIGERMMNFIPEYSRHVVAYQWD